MGKSPDVLSPKRAGKTPGADRDYVRLFKALGDQTRLEIVGMLAAASGDLCVCEIEPRFALSQPTISHHLRLLREAGVVTSIRRGSWVHYALEPSVLDALERFRALLGR